MTHQHTPSETRMRQNNGPGQVEQRSGRRSAPSEKIHDCDVSGQRPCDCTHTTRARMQNGCSISTSTPYGVITCTIRTCTGYGSAHGARNTRACTDRKSCGPDFMSIFGHRYKYNGAGLLAHTGQENKNSGRTRVCTDSTRKTSREECEKWCASICMKS